ncbi:cobyric acid synthase [Hoyosella altamirensis]|uniref:Cobyric acid synthase n=1 Tax=Hoyosella altamirensis TaxID=616997 RepID=A0A839RQC9_9ACTN|nr:cobyric acid synthase [Hoyosella altamirensis]MBB3038597.1 adenosylcobyric acid synthase [Hoyosella altamirensis]
MKGALLIAGTTSDAGKSFVVAGLCRLLARQGVKVAPFKAQNMSNNSVVTLDGGEIGRAQGLQAQACGLPPSVRFNPILLKPGSDRSSQLVIRGKAEGQLRAGDYLTHRAHLRRIAADTLRDLRDDFDVVLCEGAGSPAEINLRASDVANLGLAQAAQIPVVVVGDIDRGGVLAHLFGTLAVLDPEDQQLICGFLINKFRGDPALLAPGLEQIAERTGRPVFGAVPYLEDIWIDAEDSLSSPVGRVVGMPKPPIGEQWLRVAAVRLPRVSNATDVEALASEPGVIVRWVDDPGSIHDADLVVLPGSKATVADLEWLRATGIADVLTRRAQKEMPILGICGGYQMLGKTIHDDLESGRGKHNGLGIFDLDIVFGPVKTLAVATGTGQGFGADLAVTGYEIHHGEATRSADDPLLRSGDAFEGSQRPGVFGTHWHGLLENDEYRRAFLTHTAALAGLNGFVVSSNVSAAEERAAQLDLMADALAQHVDVERLFSLINDGLPARQPILGSRLRT